MNNSPVGEKKEPTSEAIAKVSYACSAWNGRFMHFGKSPQLTSGIIAIQAFMCCLGYTLMIMSTYPIAGVVVMGVSGFFLCRKIAACRTNEMKKGMRQIIGFEQKIKDLPFIKIEEGNKYPSLQNLKKLPHSIMRIVNSKNETRGMVFNFDEHTYSDEKRKKTIENN